MAANRGIQYIPAIDGLRAIAVIAVVLYHLGISWIPGGFLGVDLFFVISGYVITRLLLDSIQRSGGLDLRGFYLARVRRLLPPLVFMVVTSAIAIGLWAPDTIKRFLTDTPFALTGTMNWWLVYHQQDYFETIGRPPLLQHTWSLAVEAQFYLIWPLILLLVVKYFGKKQISRAALLIALVSGISLLLLSLRLDSSDVSKISHVYFGTDTHSIGLFLGAALAVSWVPQNLKTVVSRRAQDFIDAIGTIGFLGLLATFLLIDETNPALYRLAFPLAGVLGCAILLSIVHPASRFAPILQSRALLWIGERSYAIYLWHWVIFQVTRPSVDLAGNSWALFLLRILIVFALADISLRWVELPIRSGALSYWFQGRKYRAKNARRRQRATVGIASLALLLTLAGVSIRALSINNIEEVALRKSLEATPGSTSRNVNNNGLWVTGDSVILGIRSALTAHAHIGLINARVGRQAPELLDVMVRDIKSAPKSTVIFNLGNNNILTHAEVLSIFEVIKNQPKIIVVNTAVPRPWRDANNALIALVAARYANAFIVDWSSISTNHPEYFAPDGVHLAPAGAAIYVGAIVKVLG